jgi:ankyrin repeat protein
LLAVDLNHVEIARTLIAAGASINAQAANLDTPWLLAGARGRSDIVREMISHNPDRRPATVWWQCTHPGLRASACETINCCSTPIAVNHVNNLGWTCLLEIVILGDGGPRHVEATRLVLGAGADPNMADKDGVTPLAHARAKGQMEIARLIEAAGGRIGR